MVNAFNVVPVVEKILPDRPKVEVTLQFQLRFILSCVCVRLDVYVYGSNAYTLEHNVVW